MDVQNERIPLQLPLQSLNSLSFSQTDVHAVHQWLSKLSKTNSPLSFKLMRQALDELARLKVPPSMHWSLVEQFRPVVHYLIHQSQSQILNNLVTFNNSQLEEYTACLELLLKLLTVYKTIVGISLNQRDTSSPVVAAALHRALAESASILLFTCEYYRPAPDRFWLEMHTLYSIARTQHLDTFSLEDSITTKARKLSLSDIYKRVLLLSRSRSNQLRPQETRQIFKALCLWAPHSKLEAVENNRSHFVVNLDSDEGLLYSSLQDGEKNDHLLALDARLLTAHLKKLSESVSEEKPGALPKRVVDHLATAWSPPGQRKHKRHNSSNTCEICFGFSAVHYFLHDQQTFDEMVSGHTAKSQSSKSRFSSKNNSDAWSEAHDAHPDEDARTTNSPLPIHFTRSGNQGALYPVYNCSIINTCAGGYCLSTSAGLERQLRTGELLAIRESGQKNWLLAAVRWVQVNDQEGLVLGLELLSASTRSCAITPLKKTMDSSHYQRAFLLPAIPPINDMPTLITPRVSFKNGLKFILIQGGRSRKGQLLECVSSSPGYNQFKFRLLENQY
ncbi:hypothetical protein [Endozoicomonas numazuensis]|uniref:GTPase n=1 Tax=Endozoicomonas numazuensis TaxID=1137799 RepID=A0A081MZX4_9GAMM|nr:hypothetical protein [Endozoicomonas numazuensis]KEQ11747.1 hypothetical protein GZ78_28575 [Endozoicomonas numazuensis]